VRWQKLATAKLEEMEALAARIDAMKQLLREALHGDAREGEKDRARQVFRRAKSFKTKGAGLEEKILEQVRSATKLIDRLHQRRRKVAKS
jgi:hypothetical protein